MCSTAVVLYSTVVDDEKCMGKLSQTAVAARRVVLEGFYNSNVLLLLVYSNKILKWSQKHENILPTHPDLNVKGQSRRIL